MKAIAAALVFIPILTGVDAMGLAQIFKNGLGNSDCSDIHLTDRYTLHAICKDPEHRNYKEFSLDLNACYANYLGTLNRVDGGGGFGASCSPCSMSGTNLTCECAIDGSGATRHTEVDLGGWRAVQVANGQLSCSNMDSFDVEPGEKRAVTKEAQFFVA
ncbi:hypothetical protein GGS23DRAFT_600853 [Durotheca rogersii]|uniref:uncharacterized protein n=1 Tax=Durotheca rogersii TaxID=419775 RepID=UPI00221FB647|nr:uncharacterized protein GGS23DRAFT_600853 [Durotheca rogersii]KAI5857365.1 hypothetical protein GGS23DRAFT_600853 [Durotheca rogersii]